jgi:hypothetical protein
MARGGAAALSDAELIALLVEPGRKGKSSLDIAREVAADGLLAVARRERIPGNRLGVSEQSASRGSAQRSNRDIASRANAL